MGILIKKQYMSRSTFCQIKYRNIFSKAEYMIGVGFKILAHPYQIYPEFPPPTITEDMKGHINPKNSI